MDIKDNRFFVMGEGGVKYTYNNGQMASDPKLASMNFLNALEKLPGLIEQEEKKIVAMKKDVPVLQEVVNGTWTKEKQLLDLKTELAALDRKIQLSITEDKGKAIEQANGPNLNQEKQQVEISSGAKLKAIYWKS
jgi:hypothetical protein